MRPHVSPEMMEFRQRLSAEPGRSFWRSLEELADTDEFQSWLTTVFPPSVEGLQRTSRRQFLTFIGASLALAGLSGCQREMPEKIVPYVRQPEQLVTGQPLYFATAMTLGGIAAGLLVESHQGRPIKIEGNPRHPCVPGVMLAADSLHAPGVSDHLAQAAILELYDPDRSQVIRKRGQIQTWNALVDELTRKVDELNASAGKGMRILTETVSSPTLTSQIHEVLKRFPGARWHQFEPVNQDNALVAAQLMFGQPVATQLHLSRADVILSIDSDFLIEGPDHLRCAFDFAHRREPAPKSAGSRAMNRLYAIETTPTLTGLKADHRLVLSPRAVEHFVRVLAERLGVDLSAAADPADAAWSSDAEFPESARVNNWLEAVVEDLLAASDSSGDTSSLVVAGPYSSPRIHALVFAINDVLGNVGRSVTYTSPVVSDPVAQQESLRQLVDEMQAGDVDLLLVLGGNPAETAAADVDCAAGLKRVPTSIHLSLLANETSELCDWQIPEKHFLESWGDARAADGTVSLIQPLIAPLYQGYSALELLSALLGSPGDSDYDVVRQYWQDRWSNSGDFETAWQTALHEGWMENTQLPPVAVTTRSPANALKELVRQKPSDSRVGARAVPPEKDVKDSPEGSRAAWSESVDLVFRPDFSVHDGRFANNGWLQELPRPITTLTWDNAILISPALAARGGLKNGDEVTLIRGDQRVTGPAWILPGQSERTVTVHLGYGRTRSGRVGTAVGFRAAGLQLSADPWLASDVRLVRGAADEGGPLHQSDVSGDRQAPASARHTLAATQHHHLMNGRDLVRSGTLAQLQEHPEDPEFMHTGAHHGNESLFVPLAQSGEGYQWAMNIDLNRCIGCRACTVACQAENNIPVVGREQVAMGREMHWIRVDSYYEGAAENPRVVHQPVTCMHCEQAPCELVCPVAATVHDDEGLNEMVYNRCVGTRYCSNNCPYKVRRFNFLQYAELNTPVLNLLHNPQVTIRSLGVMEKCTYCTQRISAVRIRAEREDRSIQDGEVVTACQAACPSQAIVFGNLNDSHSRIHAQRENPLNFSLLEELNTRPRTTYTAALTNPNPRLNAWTAMQDPAETKAVR